MAELTPEAIEAILLSLKVALAASLCSLPPGIMIAYVLARGRFRGKLLLDILVHLPLVLPPVVVGYLLLLAFGRRGPIGAWLESTFGLVLAFRWTGAVLAAAIMGFPLMVRAIRLSFESIDPKLEAAAGTLGAGPVARFFLITLPLALPGLVVGTLLAFAKALGEFGATITFVSNIPGETRTIAAAIYTATQTPDGDPEAMTLTAIAIAIAVLALLVSEYLARRAREVMT